MKKYVKPALLEEIIEIEDICGLSGGGSVDVEEVPGTDIGDIFGNNN